MMSKRLSAIDFLRVLCMANVILGHVTSAFVYAESQHLFLGMNLAFLLNQATRFSVSLFVLLSGFSLGISRKQESYGTFIRGRALRVLIPYAVWTLLYELFNVDFDLGAFAAKLSNPLWLLRVFLTGQAAPHLYFIPIIFQLYLLYPLLRRWVDRSPGQAVLWSLVITFSLQSLNYLNSLGLAPSIQSYSFWCSFPVWMFYFVAGMALQRLDYPALCRRCRENAWPLTTLFLVFILVFSCLSSYTGNVDSIKPAIQIFVPLTFFFGVGFWERLRPGPRAEAVVARFSAWSMDIYYCHVIILCWLRRIPRFNVGMSGMLMLLLSTTLLAILFAALWGLVKGKFKSARKRQLA